MSDCVCQSESDLRTYLFSRVPEPLTHYSRKRKSGFFLPFYAGRLAKKFSWAIYSYCMFFGKENIQTLIIHSKNCSSKGCIEPPFPFYLFSCVLVGKSYLLWLWYCSIGGGGGRELLPNLRSERKPLQVYLGFLH